MIAGENMKTVILNGSPRQDGDTAALLSILKNELQGDIVQFDAYDGSIHPCTDCRHCYSQDSCTIHDAFDDLLDALDGANNVVIASPVYFSELTGPLLSVASRLQYIWISSQIRHRPVLSKRQRRGIVLLAGGGNGSYKKALDTATCLLHIMGTELIGSVCSVQTDHIPAAQDESAKQAILELVKKL